MDVIEVVTKKRRELVDITDDVKRAVAASGVREGLCRVGVPHTTAAVLINENADPDVGEDLISGLEAMLPKIDWRHAEGNSDAHLLSTLVGPAVTVPVSAGSVRLGRWQAVFLLELDGPRRRQVWVTVL